MPTLEDVALARARPETAPGVGLPEPHEIAAGLRLIHAVHAYGVVGAGAAKVLAPRRLRVVGVGPGIDQKLEAADRQRERERVGVAMGGDRLITQGAGIGNDANLLGGFEIAAENMVTAPRKRSP